jgi:3-oxoacyl-[acyl-carrier protein] reductase
MNKAVFVTGGSRGIGRAICVAFAKQGRDVVINFKSNEAEALITKSLVEAEGVRCYLLPFDVSDAAEVEKKISTWQEDHKDVFIEVLVNNAGIREDSLLLWMQDSQWRNVISTNLDSFFYVTKNLLGPMLANRSGRVINIVSLSGIKGLAGQANYSAAKAGVIGATKALAQEVAKRGVTVNAVAPGFIETEMTKDLDQHALAAIVPMKRFGKAEEVAEAVLFFASSGASYITGEVLNINGGLHM